MSETKATRLSKVAREFNVGISTIVEFLNKKGIVIDSNPNTKVSPELHGILIQEYSTDLTAKKESEKVDLKSLRSKKETVSINDVEGSTDGLDEAEDEVFINDPSGKLKKEEPKIIGKIDLDKVNKAPKPKEEKKPKPETSEEKVVEEKTVENKKTEEKVEKKVEEKEKPVEKKEIIEHIETETPKSDLDFKVVGKIDLDSMNQRTRPARKSKKEKEKERLDRKKKPEETVDSVEEVEEIETTKTNSNKESIDHIKTEITKLSGPTVVGKINLPQKEQKKEGEDSTAGGGKKKRKRIKKDNKVVSVDDKKKGVKPQVKKDFKKKKRSFRPEVSEVDVDQQIKDTLARLTKSKSKGSKYRREKRDAVRHEAEQEEMRREEEQGILKVTEFVSVSELASMMNVNPTELISTCMGLGLFVSINQRLDAETLVMLAEEYNFKVEFISVEVQESIQQDEDKEDELEPRPPIVTVMGHVDHGKTKLLDHIRSANVIDDEAGGITQHIGAYSVNLDDGRKIAFLDTPGHEAFTAMRARGAQVTDIAIIVVAADDGVKPQTIEAINHAQAAGVPIVFAINKIDKPTANPDKIKEELANMNLLVEDWGGKIQSQEISAKNGINIDDLLEKTLLEAELLELKANPNKKAIGTVIESSLDKGRGYITTILVQAGTLKIGDILLAGQYFGHVKAMYNERGKRVEEAGPSTPVLILGLDGAPQAGDAFNVMDSDKEAKEIANKRTQLQREQGLRTTKHITLDEIGRRIAIGNFQELNVIVKGDVDGSVEALSDSLIKLSNEEIQVNIIHKAVGQISEADIMLAAASNAIIVGFQVRPSLSARKLAEKEEIDVRLYSIIYDAIEEIKSAMEGMLSPEIREEIVSTLEIKEIFKIHKVGTIAGCQVKEGKIKRSSKVRVIRDGIVVYDGLLGSLKRFKDDVKEAVSGQECGLNVENYNDIKVGDIIEAYTETEHKKKL